MRLSSVTIAVMLAFVAWLSPSQALAGGSYQVSACNFAPEAGNNSWTWATNDPAQPAHYAEHANCPYRLGGSGGKADQEGGLSTTDALGLSSGAAPGTSAGWTFTAPAGTSITGLTYERYIGHQLDRSMIGLPRYARTGQSCQEKPAWIQSKTARRVLLVPHPRGRRTGSNNGSLSA